MFPESTKKPLRFYNPIAGKPAPFSLSGLFLFDPRALIKIYGTSFRRMISEEFDSAFYKKWERVSTGKQRNVSSFVKELIARLPTDSPIAEEMGSAFSGDADAQSRIENLGPWESFFLGSGENMQCMSGRGRLLVSIERASREPMCLIRAGRLSEAVAIICSDPLISLYLWPDVINVMKRCSTEKRILPARIAIACEIFLSYIAATDAELASENESSFACLIPNTKSPGKNPTSLFFSFLLNAIGEDKIPAVLDHDKARGLSLDASTLKRWSAGSHCPDLVWLRPLLNAFFDDASYRPVINRYWAAKYLNFIGYIAQTVVCQSKKIMVESGNLSAVAPWPSYPFGYSDCQSWMESRYPYWFDYHLKKRAILVDGKREKRPMGLFS